MNSSDISTLPAHPWETSYRHEDGDLVGLFYVPALSSAVRYDRTTGYFSADALVVAAQGIERLIANGGKMRLIVGCTLNVDELEAVERGYDLREQVEKKLTSIDLTPPHPEYRQGLESLAWMVANRTLDIKVAVPTDGRGEPVSVRGIYHEKVGVITDRDGNKLSFSGSINETWAGWMNNRESFHVHLSWVGGRDVKHVEDEVEAFEKLWEGRAWSVRVLDFPEAAKALLLEFLPTDDRFLTPPPPPKKAPELPPVEPSVHHLLPDEVRNVVWTYIHNAARTPNGIRVGEVTSTVKPWPHQIQTYQRLINDWPSQMLIADEVGLGKTITAGLLIRQAWLSERAKRILILMPRSLLTQWQGELYEKFNLNIPIYDGQKLVWKATHALQDPVERRVGRQQWHKEPFVLASSHLMRRRDRSADLLQAEDWDLIVLDEAHHARRKSPGTPQEGGPNQLLRLMQQLRPKCRSLLLLTGTPMQVHPVELWDLLKLLGLTGRWDMSRDDFLRYFVEASGNPGPEVMEYLAGMFRETEATFGEVTEVQTSRLIPGLGGLGCRKVLRALRDQSGIPLKRLDVPQRKAALEILRRFSPVRHRMARHTRNLLREYHRRGLIDSSIATRDVRDVSFDMAPSEKLLYDALGDYIDQTYNNAAPEKRSAVGFVLTIYQRRLASSFYALERTLTKRLANMGGITDEDLSQDETTEDAMDTEDAEALARVSLADEEKTTIRDLLKAIAKVGTNTKARKLKSELDDALADGYDSAIIFTQYADTMDFLKEYLADEYSGEPIACYSGAGGKLRDRAGFWTECSKEQIKQRLKAKAIKFLVCTDAAAEGLNFQFCGLLVNYDLPWNPMKVEQRIGRIDRIGQRYPKIRVINLAYQDTVEADVYFALGQRINLFEGLVGRLQPILSRLPRQFEEVALERKENREAARHRLMADIENSTRESGDSGLDIDEVAADSLEMPDLPEPSLNLADLDLALNHPGVLPPGTEWRRLDVGSYALRLPGMAKEVRVTTQADIFDDYFESHEFMSPGGPLFNQLTHRCVTEIEDTTDSSFGRVWLICDSLSKDCRFVGRKDNESVEIWTLGTLIDALEEDIIPGELDGSLVRPNEVVHVLA
jgi:SNF2 family DNA or RNA helicase